MKTDLNHERIRPTERCRDNRRLSGPRGAALATTEKPGPIWRDLAGHCPRRSGIHSINFRQSLDVALLDLSLAHSKTPCVTLVPELSDSLELIGIPLSTRSKVARTTAQRCAVVNDDISATAVNLNVVKLGAMTVLIRDSEARHPDRTVESSIGVFRNVLAQVRELGTELMYALCAVDRTPRPNRPKVLPTLRFVDRANSFIFDDDLPLV